MTMGKKVGAWALIAICGPFLLHSEAWAKGDLPDEEKKFTNPYNLQLRLKYDNTRPLIKFKGKEGKSYQVKECPNCRIKVSQGGEKL